jgi:hypothetical protein
METSEELQGVLISTPARTEITWAIGYTHNLGNFQSLRIDVSVKDYTRDGENAHTASERVYRFVEGELAKKIEEAKTAFE